MSKAGLVLEGGAMRAIYSAGIMDVLLEEGIRFDDITAVSAGACNAVSYISRQHCRSLLINCAFCADKRYAGWRTMLRTGSYCGMEFMFQDIPDRLIPFDWGEFKQSPQRLTVVTTDAHTGQPVYKCIENTGKDFDYIRASSSLPILTPPVLIDGQELYDGGVADAIPLKNSILRGNEKNVVVLTHNRGFTRKDSGHGIYKLALGRKRPQLYRALCRRAQDYNRQMEEVLEQERQGKAFVFMPSRPVRISRFTNEPEKILELYYTGVRDARDALPRLREFCKDVENVTFDSR